MAGNALSAYNLGRVYYTGFASTPRDDAKARVWFGEAARLGTPAAQSQYGYMLHDGIGGAADPTGALDWLRKAAEQGDVHGQARYGYYRIAGADPRASPAPDLSREVGYLVSAADKGNCSLSRLPFRRREQAMLRSRRMKTMQRFASVYANVHNHFNLERHIVDRKTFNERRSTALAQWQSLAE